MRVAALVTLLAAVTAAPPASAQLLGGAQAEGCAAAVGGAVTDSVLNVICGLDAAEIESLLRLVLDEEAARARARDARQLEAVEELQALETETQRRLDALAAGIDPLTAEAVRGFFEILGRSAAPREMLQERLAEIASRHVEMLARLALLDPADPEIAGLLAAARENVRVGRYDAADTMLARAEAAERASIAEAERLLVEAEQAVRDRRLNHAATIGERARLAETRLRHGDAGRLWQAAAAALPEDAPRLRFDYLMSAALALDRQTELTGARAGVDAAITLYDGKVLPLAEEIGDPRLWAGAMINFGNALETRGARDTDPDWLRSAISAYEAALTVFSAEDFPRDWALARSNFANSLFLLGERFGNIEALRASRAAHEDALDVFRRMDLREDVARTLHNLARVERAIGWIDSDIPAIERSIELARDSAKIRADMDQEAARLSSIEEVAKSEEALGDLRADEGSIEKAVDLMRIVAAGRDATLEPVGFATAHLALGDALAARGQRRLLREDEVKHGRADLAAALDAYETALDVVDRDEQAITWALLRQNSGNALFILGPGDSDSGSLAQARLAYEDALTVFTRERFPLEWANTTKNLGMVLFTEGQLHGNAELHQRAIERLSVSLEIFKEHGHQRQHAGTLMNTGIIRLSMGQLTGDGATLAAARADVEAARRLFRDSGATLWASNAGIILKEIAAAEDALSTP